SGNPGAPHGLLFYLFLGFCAARFEWPSIRSKSYPQAQSMGDPRFVVPPDLGSGASGRSGAPARGTSLDGATLQPPLGVTAPVQFLPTRPLGRARAPAVTPRRTVRKFLDISHVGTNCLAGSDRPRTRIVDHGQTHTRPY